jgi:hypothetical protein
LNQSLEEKKELELTEEDKRKRKKKKNSTPNSIAP